jgi:hypothetical protein
MRVKAMGESELENLALFYKTMTTDQLVTYRAALEADRDQARKSKGKRGKHTTDFCTTRIDLIVRVLGERGVTMEKLT